jgi:hypothetical protein
MTESPMAVTWPQTNPAVQGPTETGRVVVVIGAVVVGARALVVGVGFGLVVVVG